MDTSQDKYRIFGLDILRMCAVISLVAAHGSFLTRDTFLENFPWLIFLDGVDLFFILSGFLIGTILLKEINQNTGFTIPKLANFWKRRWFRTLPNYYLILVLNFVFIKLYFIRGNTEFFNWKYLFFLHNFSSSFDDFFMESWSLSVEEWFYIITPLILYLLLKKIKPKTSFIVTLVILIVFSIIVRYIKANPTADGYYVDVEIRKVVLTRLDAIGYGLFAAWVAFYYEDFWRKYKIHAFIIGIALHFFIVNFDGNYIFFQIIGASLVPLSYMFLLPLATAIKTGRGFIAKCVTHISKISYSMYLINLGLVGNFMGLHFPVKNTTDGLIKYAIYWAVIIALSSVIYKYYEKPIMDLRNKRKTVY